MGQTLTGTQINNTYPGLLKTTDNLSLGATEKVMGDGLGNDSTLSLGTSSASFTGTLDLSGATVTGIAAGGLEDGTGLNSMQSNLSDIPASATGTSSVAIGRNARSTSEGALALSNYAYANGAKAIALGQESTAGANGISAGWLSNSTTNAISIGLSSEGLGISSVGVGHNAHAKAANSVAIGDAVTAFATKSVVIGTSASDADAVRVNSVTIGQNVNTAQYSVNIGNDQNNYSADSVMIGNSNVTSSNYQVMIGYGNSISLYDNQITIGRGNSSALANSGVIGYNLSSLWSNGITMNQIAIANYLNLNFADNSAAATGGVPLGGIYHTDGNLKVRHT